MTTSSQPSAARLALLAALLVALLLALAGCAMPRQETPSQIDQPGGGVNPESVTQSFFEDLGSALKDPQLADDDKRGAWAERLAGYFAPAERDDQRIALGSALDNFASGLGKLEDNESLTLELRFERVVKISEANDRARVRPVNGSIYVLITRSTTAGVVTLYEDNVSLDKIIGGDDGAVPVVRIGRTWYLSEG
ncbi:MAG: hypothetical protein IPO81_25850 [Kouleothrix sp.]|nr:hypothetical protein [Kouleothrix sp.]